MYVCMMYDVCICMYVCMYVVCTVQYNMYCMYAHENYSSSMHSVFEYRDAGLHLRAPESEKKNRINYKGPGPGLGVLVSVLIIISMAP